MNTPCPDDATLVAFHLGRLSEQDVATVGDHLETCLACEHRIERIESQADDLVSALQHQVSSQPWKQLQGRGAPVENGAVSPFPEVPGYHIDSCIGHGGMAIVFKATQLSLKRFVALKQLHVRNPRLLPRAVKEAELLAQLRHPNIVQIYEVLQQDGQFFMSLEWIDGGSLAEQLTGAPWPANEAAMLVMTLARTIHHAHLLGVIHRDLKPANILLRAGSLSPTISDFGIARELAEGQRQTQDGDVLGTPTYMSPEQSMGNVAPVGPASDIYSLGVILYELLTGRVPLHGPTSLDTLMLVRSQEPVAPRRLQPTVPLDLDTICMKCLLKSPERRYASASELADDLERYLGDRPIMARRPSAWDQWRRFQKRYRTLVTTLGAVFATISLGFGFTLIYAIGEGHQRRLAEASAKLADSERRSALGEAYRGRLAAAIAAVQSHDVIEAARQLEAAPELLRGWEWQHLSAQLDQSETLWATEGNKCFIVDSPDQPEIAIGVGRSLQYFELSGQKSRRDTSVINQLINIGPEYSWRPLPHSPGCLHAFNELESRIFDQQGKSLYQGKRISVCAISPDSKKLAIVTEAHKNFNQIDILSLDDEQSAAVCAGHTGVIHDLRFSADGQRLASASEDSTARIWDVASGKEIAVCIGHSVKVYHVAFRRDGQRLLTTSADGSVRQWNTNDGLPCEAPFEQHGGEVSTAEYSADGHRIASAGADRCIRVWQAETGQELLQWHGHTAAVEHLVFCRDDKQLLSEGADDTVRRWNLETQDHRHVLRGHTSYVYPVAFHPRDACLASGSWDQQVKLWSTADGVCQADLPHPSRVQTLAFHPSGQWLVTGCGEDATLRIWDYTTRQLQAEIEGPGPSIYAIAFSPDGKHIAVVDQASQASVIEFSTRKCIDRFTSGSYSAQIAFSPDGHWLALGGKDGRLYIRSIREPHKFYEAPGHTGGITAIAFFPDGKQLVSASHDRTLRIWRLAPDEAPRCIQTLLGHSDAVFSVAIHPDGSRIASAGRDGVIRLWQPGEDQELAWLQGHRNYVWSLAFSPNGRTLASGSGDSTVRLWSTRN